MVSFLTRICAIWVFPHPNLFANCLALCACSLGACITSTFSHRLRHFRVGSWFCFLSSFKALASFLGFFPFSVFFLKQPGVSSSAGTKQSLDLLQVDFFTCQTNIFCTTRTAKTARHFKHVVCPKHSIAMRL